MEFQTYARMLLHRWWLILGLAAVAAAVTYGYAIQAQPMYRATAQLSVTPSVVDYFTGEAVQRLLNNYAFRLRSKPFAAQTAARLSCSKDVGQCTAGAANDASPSPGGAPPGTQQPPAPGGALVGKIKAVASPTEYRIAIEVDDPQPARAQDIANAAAATFVDVSRAENAGRERRDVEVQILELADLPEAPVQPRPRRDALGAATLGALIGIGLAFLLEYLDDTFRSAEEAATSLGLPVLAAIPDTERRSRKGVLTHGLRPRRPSGRGDPQRTTLTGSGGVPDTAH